MKNERESRTRPRFSALRTVLGALAAPISEEAEGLTARAGTKAVLHAPRRTGDEVHGSVALARDKQFVASEHHVHWLPADLDRCMPAKRGIDQAHGVAFQAGDAEQFVVRAVAGD